MLITAIQGIINSRYARTLIMGGSIAFIIALSHYTHRIIYARLSIHSFINALNSIPSDQLADSLTQRVESAFSHVPLTLNESSYSNTPYPDSLSNITQHTLQTRITSIVGTHFTLYLRHSKQLNVLDVSYPLSSISLPFLWQLSVYIFTLIALSIITMWNLILRNKRLGTSQSKEAPHSFKYNGKNDSDVRHSFYYYMTACNESPLGIIILGQDYDLKYYNTCSAEWFNLSEHYLNQSFHQMVHNPELCRLIKQTIHLGKPCSQDICIKRKNERLVKTTCTIHNSNDAHPFIIIFAMDTTEIEKLEHTRREFVSDISHEIKTPLSIISNAIETILYRHPKKYDEFDQMLNTIKRHTFRLNTITDNMLFLSQLECDPKSFTQSEVPFNIIDTIHVAIQSASQKAEEKKISIHYKHPVQDLHIWSNRFLIKTIIEHLLDNAISFSSNSSIISVTLLKLKTRIHLMISDTGNGIEQAEHQKIFKRFYRIDTSRTRERGGSGLGLSIVKHALDILGGTIDVTSQIGSGSTFNIYFPIQITLSSKSSLLSEHSPIQSLIKH